MITAAFATSASAALCLVYALNVVLLSWVWRAVGIAMPALAVMAVFSVRYEVYVGWWVLLFGVALWNYRLDSVILPDQEERERQRLPVLVADYEPAARPFVTVKISYYLAMLDDPWSSSRLRERYIDWSALIERHLKKWRMPTPVVLLGLAVVPIFSAFRFSSYVLSAFYLGLFAVMSSIWMLGLSDRAREGQIGVSVRGDAPWCPPFGLARPVRGDGVKLWTDDSTQPGRMREIDTSLCRPVAYTVKRDWRMRRMASLSVVLDSGRQATFHGRPRNIRKLAAAAGWELGMDFS